MDGRESVPISRLPAGLGGLPHVPHHTRASPPLTSSFGRCHGHFHWDHFTYFRLLVLAMA